MYKSEKRAAVRWEWKYSICKSNENIYCTAVDWSNYMDNENISFQKKGFKAQNE